VEYTANADRFEKYHTKSDAKLDIRGNGSVDLRKQNEFIFKRRTHVVYKNVIATREHENPHKSPIRAYKNHKVNTWAKIVNDDVQMKLASQSPTRHESLK